MTSATPKPRAGEHVASSTPETDALCSDPAIERRDVPARVWREMARIEAERDALRAREAELVAALEKIASCHSAFDGDVVSIAYKALARVRP